MSSRELEERQEREQAAKVAEALRITVEELQSLDWTLEPNETADGALAGYNVTFDEKSDAEVLAKVPGLVDGRWVRIGPIL